MKLARDGDIYFEIVFSNELNVLLALAARTALCTVSMHVYTLYSVHTSHSLCWFYFPFYLFFFSSSFFLSNEWFMVFGIICMDCSHQRTTYDYGEYLETILNRIKRIWTLKNLCTDIYLACVVIALIAGCRLCYELCQAVCCCRCLCVCFSLHCFAWNDIQVCLLSACEHAQNDKVLCNLKKSQIKMDPKE